MGEIIVWPKASSPLPFGAGSSSAWLQGPAGIPAMRRMSFALATVRANAVHYRLRTHLAPKSVTESRWRIHRTRNARPVGVFHQSSETEQ
jgi:hypothetical protein